MLLPKGTTKADPLYLRSAFLYLKINIINMPQNFKKYRDKKRKLKLVLNQNRKSHPKLHRESTAILTSLI